MMGLSGKFKMSTHLFRVLANLEEKLKMEAHNELKNYVIQSKLREEFDQMNKKDVLGKL
jgi:hypothetical protein